MSNLMGMLTTIQSYVWGPPTLLLLIGTGPVSYTHLDVYKRQIENCIVESRDTIRANTRHVGEDGVKVVIEKNERYAL